MNEPSKPLAPTDALPEPSQGIDYIHHSARPAHSHQYLYGPIAGFLEQVPAQSVVVDVGCGNGSFLARFRDRGWLLYGSDLSSTGIALGRKNYPEITFFLADAEKKFEDFAARYGQADVIISTEVIEHLYAPRDFLRGCFSLLKPGGRLVISTPYHGYLKNVALALTNSMDKHYTVLRDHGHIKFFSRNTISKVIAEAGFTDIQFAGAGRFPYLWKSMVLSCRKPEADGK